MRSEEPFQISGIVPVLVAPFNADEELDIKSLSNLVKFSVKAGISAVCLPAYGSEFYKLSMEERYEMVRTSVEASEGGLAVIAQSNHVSAKLAAEIARRNERLGAAAISVAVPRVFPISEDDIFRFLAQVIEATSLPIVVQDFNPGGSTISVGLVGRLRKLYPQFRYLKLEEPLLARKVREISEETAGGVQVLEGWGGLYLCELIPVGICGAMPGLGMADLMQRAFVLGKAGDMKGAFDIFERILPHIVFSLQNMELFLYMEKYLLLKRGIIRCAKVRSATFEPDPDTINHVQFLTERVLRTIAESASQKKL